MIRPDATKQQARWARRTDMNFEFWYGAAVVCFVVGVLCTAAAIDYTLWLLLLGIPLLISPLFVINLHWTARQGRRYLIPEVRDHAETPEQYSPSLTGAVERCEKIRLSLPDDMAATLKPVTRRMVDYLDLAVRDPNHPDPARAIGARYVEFQAIKIEQQRLHTASQVVNDDDGDLAYARSLREVMTQIRREQFGQQPDEETERPGVAGVHRRPLPDLAAALQARLFSKRR